MGRRQLALAGLVLLNSLTGAAQTKECEVCTWLAPVSATVLSRQIECDDFYMAACLDEKGELRHQGKMSDGTPEVKATIEVVRAAKDVAAFMAGGKDFKDLLIKQLDANNLKTNKDLNLEAKARIAEGRMAYVSDSDLKEIFTSYGACQGEMDKAVLATDLVLNSSADDTTIKELEKNQAKENRFLISQKSGEMKAQLSENVSLLFDKISTKCQDYSKYSLFAAANPSASETALKKICERKREIRMDAIEAYRTSDTAQGAKLAKSFVEKYFSFVAFNESSKDVRSNLEEQRQYLKDNVCAPLKDTLLLKAKEVINEVSTKISTSQVVVEAVLGKIYSAKRKESLNKIYKMIVREILAFAERQNFSREDIAKMRADYANVELAWIETPKSDFFVKDSTLDIAVLPQFKSQVFESEYAVFSDPDLAYFTEYNASYQPPIAFGSISKKATITMMPMILEYLDSNTWSFLHVLAHETAHKIGPEISEVNGYKIREKYNDILACYSASDSIALKPGQQDETMADFISSEVIAVLIKQLPQDQKSNAVYSAHQFSCLAESWGIYEYSTSKKGLEATHPAMRLRAAGIFGANPHIREHLGCQQESKMFRSCAMGEVK